MIARSVLAGIPFALVASLWLAPSGHLAAAETPATPQCPDCWSWSGKVAAGHRLAIHGINGNVRAEGTDGQTVEVSARKTKGDPSKVEIRVQQHGGDVDICVIQPHTRNTPCGSGPLAGERDWEGGNETDVAISVKVPKGVLFGGHTVNGDVAATGLTADAEVSTVNGDAEVASAGRTEARTVNGSVRARMGATAWSAPLRLETVNGDVEVTLQGEPKLTITGSTVNGDIESDYPVTIQGKWGPRRMSGTVNGGGSRLELKTVNGKISLRRQA